MELLKSAAIISHAGAVTYSLGGLIDDREITRIELYSTEYSDSAHTIVYIYSDEVLLKSLFDCPLDVAYLIM